MADYKYSHKPRGILRTLLATWRVLRDKEDINANVKEAAIVEFAFNRSWWGKKIARWDLLAEEVAATSPRAAQAMAARRRMPEYDLDKLAALPVGTLGHTFATVARQRGIDPNLVDPIPHDSDADWLMAHMYETHDLWHLLTGYYYNTEGEFGVAGFYMGQVPKFSFIAFFSALLTIRTVWNDRDAVGTQMQAFSEGYEMGRRAECVIGLDWTACFERNLDELRAELGIADAGKIPDLALAA